MPLLLCNDGIFYRLNQKEINNTTLKKPTLNNLFFGLFLLLILIPTSRSFIQLNLQKALSKVVPANIIEASEQKKLSTYNIQFKGVNTSNLDFKTKKGKVIFINFWATWCPPCIAEMPALQKLYKKYNQDMVFLFVTNDNKERIINFLNEKKIIVPIYQHLSRMPVELKYNTLPSTFIIDKKGNIVLYKTGVANWNSTSFYKIMDGLVSK